MEIVSLRVVGLGILIVRASRTPCAWTARGPARPASAAYFGPILATAPDADHRPSDLTTPRDGPCIVEEYDATCVIPPGARASLDAHGNIVIDLPREGEVIRHGVRPDRLRAFRNTLLSIADEMALTILRTAYSGVLRQHGLLDGVLRRRGTDGGAGAHASRASRRFPMRWRRRSRGTVTACSPATSIA